MFDPRSILDAIVKGAGEPQTRSSAGRDDALGPIGDLLKQIAGGDGRAPDPGTPATRTGGRSDAPAPDLDTGGGTEREDVETSRSARAPARPKSPREASEADDAGATPGGGLQDIIRDVLGGKGGGNLKDILDQVQKNGGLGDVLGPVLGQIFGQGKGPSARLADTPDAGGDLAGRFKALAGGRSPEELMAALKELVANNQFGAGAAAGGLGALVLGTQTGRSLAATAAKLGGIALIGGLAYRAYTNYQQGAPATPDAVAHQKLIAAPAGSGFEAATVSHDLATTMLKTMIAAAAADGRIDAAEQQKLVASLGGSAMTEQARAFLADEIAKPATIEEIAAAVQSEEEAVQVFTAARITVDPDREEEHAFLARLADALGLDDGLVAHIDAAARGKV